MGNDEMERWYKCIVCALSADLTEFRRILWSNLSNLNVNLQMKMLATSLFVWLSWCEHNELN